MRNIYVIITGTIYDIGGSLIYVNNKRDYLERNGWIVHVFSAQFGDSICISGLEQYKDKIILELKYPPSIFPEKKKKYIIDNVVHAIEGELKFDSNDLIIIESNTITSSMWGELIAEKLNCKHFLYLLYEKYPKLHPSLLKYFDFKHQRKELAGIVSKSLDLLFNNYKIVHDNEKYYLRASILNVVSDSENALINDIERQLVDFNIGCLSRLDKTFIMTLIDNIVIFANKYPQRKILLLFIGDTANQNIKKQIKKVTQNSNIHLAIPGYMHPIPKKIFKMMDIFFATAGCAQLCAYHGALTVPIDTITHKPIGYLGCTTEQVVYGDPNTSLTILEVLEEILIHKKIPQNDNRYKINLTDYLYEYDKHMDFIFSSEKEKIYYSLISDVPKNKKYIILRILSKFFGLKGAFFIESAYRRIMT